MFVKYSIRFKRKMPYNVQVVDCIRKEIHNKIQEIKYKSDLKEFIYSLKNEKFSYSQVGSCLLSKAPSFLFVVEDLEEQEAAESPYAAKNSLPKL